MSYYRRGRGIKLSAGLRNVGSNFTSATNHCRWCGKFLAEGEGRVWQDPRGYMHAKCACGCGGVTEALPPAQQAPSLLGAIPVDVAKDGEVVCGYLLADGSLVTRR